MAINPKGFWSYARLDDAHLDGVLTRLRARLVGEVSSLLGTEVDIFQDIFDLRTGDKWADRLRAELTEASFLIPVLTPRYFMREWCREETLTFLELARERGVQPLIFPVRFIEFDEDPDCEVRAALEPFQFKDFSQWRFESDPTARARTEYEFAQDVKAKLKAPDRRVEKTKKASTKSTPRMSESESGSPDVPKPPSIPEYVVDQWPGRGDFRTIRAALKAAESGARILIRPGIYDENLVLDKPLELIGETSDEEVVVTASKLNTINVVSSLALVKNIRFFRAEGKGHQVAGMISKGRAVFEDCKFTSKSISGVHIIGAGTSPKFRRCVFEDCAEAGVSSWKNSTPTFEDCSFERNGLSGAILRSSSNAEFRDCLFQENEQSGAFVNEYSHGVFRDCTFQNNGEDGVATHSNGNAVLHRCRVIDNACYGFDVEDLNGRGTVERCTFRGNVLGNWNFPKGSEPNVIRRGNIEE